MQRTFLKSEVTPSSPSTLQSLLSRSEDEFYGRLQRIWNNTVQLENVGIVHTENDKFLYAYRFADIERQRAYSGNELAIDIPAVS